LISIYREWRTRVLASSSGVAVQRQADIYLSIEGELEKEECILHE
jgi:hypothetical protein